MALFRHAPPNGGIEYKGLKNRDFHPIYRLISKTIQDTGHSYYGMRTGNRTQAFEQYHIQLL